MFRSVCESSFATGNSSLKRSPPFSCRLELLKDYFPNVVFDGRLLHVLMCGVMTQGTLL